MGILARVHRGKNLCDFPSMRDQRGVLVNTTTVDSPCRELQSLSERKVGVAEKRVAQTTQTLFFGPLLLYLPGTRANPHDSISERRKYKMIMPPPTSPDCVHLSDVWT